MTALTEQCRQGKCIDVSAHAALCGIPEKVFISTALWDEYIILPPDTVLKEKDPRLSLLLWEVAKTREDYDTFPVLVSVGSGGKLLVSQIAIVKVTGNEMLIQTEEEEL